jgi:hypothetical protein
VPDTGTNPLQAPDMAEMQFIILCPGKSLVRFGDRPVAPTGVHIGCETCDKRWVFEVRGLAGSGSPQGLQSHICRLTGSWMARRAWR